MFPPNHFEILFGVTLTFKKDGIYYGNYLIWLAWNSIHTKKVPSGWKKGEINLKITSSNSVLSLADAYAGGEDRRRGEK